MRTEDIELFPVILVCTTVLFFVLRTSKVLGESILAMHAIMASAALMTMVWLVIMMSTNESLLPVADAFVVVHNHHHCHHHHHSLHPTGGSGSNNINITFRRPSTRAVGRRRLMNIMAQISQGEAQKAIDTVVATLRKDAAAKKDLGTLDKVTVVLGYGR
jgi:hypothetical protein